MEERRIDQHQRREPQRDSRPGWSNFRSDYAKDYHHCVCYVEIAPLRREIKNIACPVLPIEDKLF